MCGEAFGGEIRVLPPVRARISSEASPGAVPSRGHLVAGLAGVQPPFCPFTALPLLLPRSVPAQDGSPSGPQSFACPQGCVLPCSRLVMLLRGSTDVLCWLGPTKILASWVPTVLALGGCTVSTCPANSPPPRPRCSQIPLGPCLCSRPHPRSSPQLQAGQGHGARLLTVSWGCFQPEGQNVPVLSFQFGFELCFLLLFED